MKINLVLSLLLLIWISCVLAHKGNTEKKLKIYFDDIKGPTQEQLDNIAIKAFKDRRVKKYLKNNRYRLLSVEIVNEENEEKGEEYIPSEYLATVYDYTNNRAILIRGSIRNGKVNLVEESGLQPHPNNEEFEEAVEILRENGNFSYPLQHNLTNVFLDIVPTIIGEFPDGRTERILAMHLHSENPEYPNETVGVNMSRRTVVRYGLDHPHGSCGIAPGMDRGSKEGLIGSKRIRVVRGNTKLWEFEVIRPSSSSGTKTKRSGVELRGVRYKGKKVLYRAHVPILNVKYENTSICGPYRDWQWEESTFEAYGVDIGRGIRFCSQPPRTILESKSDTGNFRGVAIYVVGQQIVLVSQLKAGWYRYISEWRLHANGTIQPRFGFTAINNHCVCNKHTHHVYWRLDFDIRTAGNNIVREYNDPPIFSSKYHTKSYEINRLKSVSHRRHWEIRNAAGGDSYALIPGSQDGMADNEFGYGDLWVLKYHKNELDDGRTLIQGEDAKADLKRFVNGESVYKKDVVLWYAAHFSHVIHHELGRVVGPDLTPIKW
ncbi:uncharacterized protein VTP21DRAFT_8833 [Calcarisporiella thermophila]|uniref:uncharacterized protein n=1 Tax=Calcarisporiella thermophila TaxID=911321 RepID=UPI003742D3B8